MPNFQDSQYVLQIRDHNPKLLKVFRKSSYIYILYIYMYLWGDFLLKNWRFNEMSYRNDPCQDGIWGDPFCWEIPNGPCVSLSAFSPPFEWFHMQTPDSRKRFYKCSSSSYLQSHVLRSKKESILSQSPWNSMFQRQTVKLWEQKTRLGQISSTPENTPQKNDYISWNAKSEAYFSELPTTCPKRFLGTKGLGNKCSDQNRDQ